MPDPIKGLPEGVELTGKFTPATEDDYELQSDANGPYITKGARPGAASGVLVKPAPGYTFRADVRSGIPGAGLRYFPVKMLPTTTVKGMVSFAVDNSYDLETAKMFIEKARQLPGFVDLSVEQDPK